MNISGNTNLNASITVTGNSTFNNSSTFISSLNISGNANLNASITVTGNSTFNDISTFLNTLNISGSTNINSSLNVSGNAIFYNNVGINNSGPSYNLDVGGSLRTTGNFLLQKAFPTLKLHDSASKIPTIEFLRNGAATTTYGFGSRYDWALKTDGTSGEFLNITTAVYSNGSVNERYCVVFQNDGGVRIGNTGTLPSTTALGVSGNILIT